MRHVIQGDQKVCVHLTITIQSLGARRLFDYPVHVSITGNDNNRKSKNSGDDTGSMPRIGDQHSDVPSLNSGRGHVI